MNTTPKFTPATLPVTVSILSRWIDWNGWDKDKSDNTAPVFRFLVELTHGDPEHPSSRRMRTEYGGGIMAFIPDAKRKEWSRSHKGSGTFIPPHVGEVMSGKRYKYSPARAASGHASPESALKFMLDRAEITAASVCHSLVIDAQAGAESFADFCANLGYDEDSRKALSVYEACQKVSKEFRQLVGADFAAIEEALQDY